MSEKETVNHSVNMINREKIEVVGVNEVVCSTEKEVVAKLAEMFFVINGSNLTVTKLVPEEKMLVVKGDIDMIKYERRITKKSFLGRVLK